MPEPPETLLTIGEIAARVRHLAKDPYAFTERARHWAKLGLLVAADNVGEGSGRHALFRETEAFMAAAVNAFAEAGLQPAGSRPVADAQGMARAELATWLQEKTKGRPRPMLLEINFYPGGRWDLEVRRGARKRIDDREAAVLQARGIDPKVPAMTTITVNLGELFASVAKAAEAAKSRTTLTG